MPLLLTPTVAFETTATLKVASVYAIILKVSYDTDTAIIDFRVGYYADEAARIARVEKLCINALPTSFEQPATAEQADAVGIFTFLEQVLTTQLTDLFGSTVTIENVP